MNRLIRWGLGVITLIALLGWLVAPGAQPSPLPEKLKAVQYFQSDSNLRTFWNNFDQGELVRDFDLIRSAGFNAVILMIPWGEFQSSINPVTHNTHMIAALRNVIQEAGRRGFWVILRMGSHEFIPQGAQGGDWWAGAVLTNDREFAAYRELFRRIAEETRDYSRMVYFWSWEDTYLWPQPWYGQLEDNRQAWREWCRRHNSSLDFWNRRWEEQHQTWDDVELPESRRYLGGAKVGDFWAFQDELILKRAGELASALREGNPHGIIGFEARIDPDDTYHHRDTFRALADYDFVASWYYPYQGVPLTHVAPLQEVGQAMRELALQLQIVSAWSGKPVFFEQIGAAVRSEHPEHQRLFLTAATDFLLANSLGYGVWAWKDYVLNAVYNPGFELELTRWNAEGAWELVSDPDRAQAGTHAIRLFPGAQIWQDISGYGGQFSSCWSRTEGGEMATLRVMIERYLDGTSTDRQEETIAVDSLYRLHEVKWQSSQGANRARVTIQAPRENKVPVLIDTVRCYNFTSYLGLCDAQSAPRQPLLTQLTEVNRGNGRLLAWALRNRWWSLARRLGLTKARVDEARRPGEGL